ncbi:amidohydrolase [Propioniciclava soli]|uniref:Amidohydrolase n=1 Tax=Propioniciclava soli TaxID=2775081 RepID=A0ABZ3CBZ1_9ACTN
MTTFTHARLFTGLLADPTVDPEALCAFTVADGRITWVGPVGDVPAEAAASDDVIDLGGARVLPGMLDVHTHPLFMALLADATNLLPPTCRSKADVLAALRAHPGWGAGPDAWVSGFGYNEDAYPDGGPTRVDLDALTSTQPVLLRRADGHNALVNSVALARAGLDDASPDPAGGRLGRDADGHLDGRLIESAAVDLVARHQPAPTASDLADRLVALNDHFLGFGLVALDDLLATFVDDPLTVYRLAVERGFLPQVAVFFGWDPDAMPPVTDADRTGQIRIGGVKVFMDGAYSSRTAWVEECYPGSHDHGLATATDDDLRAAADWARANGVQCRIHVMGDRGITHLLDLFADATPWLAERPSIVFEHCTLVTPAMLARIAAARMRFGLVTHTIFFFAECESYRANLNPSAAEHAYPLRRLLDAGATVALASDSPATTWVDCDNPFTSIRAAVDRRTWDGSAFTPSQAIGVGEALELYTGRAAQITQLRGVGRLAPGYDASFVVLDADPFAVPTDALGDLRIQQTWLRGELVHGA